MRDKLEGVRPSDMPGVELRKQTATASGDAGSTRIHVALGWILAFVAIAIGVTVYKRNAGQTVAARAAAAAANPERTYAGSSMQPFVVAQFIPSSGSGKTYSSASVSLVGKGGLRADLRLPASCMEAPIEARVHRLIRVRVDTWRLRNGGMERAVIDDEARAAVCDGFGGRDVPMGREEKTRE